MKNNKKLSKIHKQNISNALKGRKLSKKHKQKISEVTKGKNHPMYGKKHSKKSKRKMRKARVGSKLKEETKQKIRERLIGIKFTETRKQNISNALKGRKLSKKHKESVSKGHLGLKHTKATKKKISDAHKGSKNYSWKGGRIVTPKGYVYIYKPNHIRASKNGYVLEHRLAMEKKIGRYLSKSEIIHHINGIKGDNRIKNLVITSLRWHRFHYHKKDRRCEVKGCDNKHVALGYCNKHYKRFRRYEAKKITI